MFLMLLLDIVVNYSDYHYKYQTNFHFYQMFVFIVVYRKGMNMKCFYLMFLITISIFDLANAQDIQSFSPANGSWNFVSLDSSSTVGVRKFVYSSYINYAKGTVVENSQTTGDTVSVLIENLTTTNFLASYGVSDKIEIGVDVPYGFSGGLKSTRTNWLSSEVQQSLDDGTGLNNVKINPKLSLLKPKGDTGFGIAFSMPQSIPLKNEKQELLSAYYVTNAKLIVDYRFKSIRIGTNVMYRHRLSSKKAKTAHHCDPDESVCSNPFYLGDAVQYGIAFAWKFMDDFEYVSEVYGRYFYNQNLNPIEFLNGLKIKAIDSININLAVGRGVNQYISTPDFRFVFGLTYVQDQFKDTDEDGILDEVDLCKDEKEDFDKFEDQDGCPDVDNDRDMIEDQVDKCPTKPEDLDGFEDQDGCPDLDNDKDGYLDMRDTCPNQAEDFDKYQDQDGCPDENDLSKNVKIHKGQLIVAGRFYFGKDSTSILTPESDFVLNSLADMLILNQKIRKIVIENHIDNQYDELTCLKITQGRADNIRDQLIARGVEANRIEAVGFGNLNPIFYVKNNILASKNVLVKIKEYE